MLLFYNGWPDLLPMAGQIYYHEHYLFHSIIYSNKAYFLMFVLTCLLTFVFFVIGQRYEHHPYRKKDLPIVLGILLPSYGFFSWLIVNAIFVSLVTFDVLTHKSSQVLVDVTSKSCSTVKGQVNCYLIINGEKHYLPIERLQNIQLGKTNVVIREYWLGTKIE